MKRGEGIVRGEGVELCRHVWRGCVGKGRCMFGEEGEGEKRAWVLEIKLTSIPIREVGALSSVSAFG